MQCHIYFMYEKKRGTSACQNDAFFVTKHSLETASGFRSFRIIAIAAKHIILKTTWPHYSFAIRTNTRP